MYGSPGVTLLQPMPKVGVNPFNSRSSLMNSAVLALRPIWPSVCIFELLKNVPHKPLT
jgi:hypothetical protein